MPRPRRDSEILPARERLENAFWMLLGERPFAKITVTDVVREAQVNRNSFYYHFSGLPELADSAIMHEVERIPLPPAPTPTTDPIAAWAHFCSSLVQNQESMQILDHLAILLGPHSNRELNDALRDFLRLTLMSLFHLTPATMDTRMQLLLDFTVGGILSILRQWPSVRNDITVHELVDRDVAILSTGLYLTLLNRDTTEYWHRLYLDSARFGNRNPISIIPTQY